MSLFQKSRFSFEWKADYFFKPEWWVDRAEVGPCPRAKTPLLGLPQRVAEEPRVLLISPSLHSEQSSAQIKSEVSLVPLVPGSSLWDFQLLGRNKFFGQKSCPHQTSLTAPCVRLDRVTADKPTLAPRTRGDGHVFPEARVPYPCLLAALPVPVISPLACKFLKG